MLLILLLFKNCSCFLLQYQKRNNRHTHTQTYRAIYTLFSVFKVTLSMPCGVFDFLCATLFYLFPWQCHHTNGRMEGRERAVIAKLLIVHANNKATGMLNKSEPLPAYPFEGFRWNRVEPIGIEMGVVWPCGRVEQTCSVDRAL